MGIAHLIEFHLIFSLDQKFLLNLAFDQMHFLSLDQKFYYWTFLCSHYIELFLRFHLIESSNNGILGFKNFWSSAKKESTDFGTWSKVFKLIELVLMANFKPYFLANSTFDQVPKSVGSFLALNRKF